MQSCVQINYPNNYNYTRSVEIKHVTKQKHKQTIISYEYPNNTGDPYYPVINSTNIDKYKQYKSNAEKLRFSKKIYFAGRLAEYKYMNIDHAIEKAIKTFDIIISDNIKK